MKTSRIALCLLAAASTVLSGCITYVDTSDMGTVSAHVSNQGKAELVWVKQAGQGLHKDKVTLVPVNDEATSGSRARSERFWVEPGPTVLSVTYVAYRGTTPGYAGGVFSVDLEAGHRYYATGVVEGDVVTLSIMDATDEVTVSELYRSHIEWADPVRVGTEAYSRAE